METTYIYKLAFIYLQGNNILETRSRGKDTWYIPGGKREAGEDDVSALIREIREELSVELRPETIVYYGTFEAQAHGKPEGTMVRMTCYTAAFTGQLIPASEVEEFAYFSYADRNKVSPVDQLIFEDIKAKKLID